MYRLYHPDTPVFAQVFTQEKRKHIPTQRLVLKCSQQIFLEEPKAKNTSNVYQQMNG